MASRKLFDRFAVGSPGRGLGQQADGPEPDEDKDDLAFATAPLGGTRGEALQRLQIGITTFAVMLTMIGLAGVIGSQAELAEEAAVPDAAPTTEPTATPAQRDPLVDAGVVPDIPAEIEAEEPLETEEPGAPVIVPDTPPPGVLPSELEEGLDTGAPDDVDEQR